MVYDGSATVTTAGTRVRLAATRTAADWVIVQALNTNTNAVYVGGSTVAAARGVRLLSGDSVAFPVISGTTMYDLREIWLDAAVNGEGVQFTYGRR